MKPQLRAIPPAVPHLILVRPMERLAFWCNLAVIPLTLVALLCLKLYIMMTEDIGARWAVLPIVYSMAVIWFFVWILGLVGLLLNARKKEPLYLRAMNQAFLCVALFVLVSHYA
jgi:hypothetical protein